MPAQHVQRASPEALLALARQQGRGRLKIFLGAAPGVGKTYAMLTAARAAKAEGRKVLVGIAETHGRAETEALLEGLEVLPRKPMVYLNRMMSEFDIDAALAWRPDLLLVDEYAHTNIPGGRHPKRWQDIEELLAAGIDVWTTLNVQHMESLNDVIRKITRVRVRETVPDSIFEAADDVVLIDLPPDELLKRLAEGKVYLQDTAARAREGFFKHQNLAALRELALRRAAERIDADLVQRMQAQAIDGPLPAGERILACVGTDDDPSRIVRSAKRMADLMDAPWLAVHVERAGGRDSETARQSVADALKLAEALGGESRTVVGTDIVAEILRLSRFENVTQIVIGCAPGRRLAQVLGRSLPHELVRRAEGIGIHVVTGPSSAVHRRPGSPGRRGYVVDAAAFAWSTLAVITALAISVALTTITVVPNPALVFLLAVFLAAVAFGVWPAVYASALSFLTMNFFFIAPLYTFTVAEPHELLSLIIFLAVSIIAATLAGRVRQQARHGAQRLRGLRRLYEFTRKLSSQATAYGVAEVAVGEINANLARPAAVLLDEGGELKLSASWPPIEALDAAAMTAARWAFAKNEVAGTDTATLPTIPWRFLPLRSMRGRVGVVGVARAEEDPGLDPESLALLETVAEQTAAALERASLAREMAFARSAVETERVRNTLLASVSHDFRTPLSSILGSATSLIDYGDKLGPDGQKDLLGQIKHEAEALDAMVRNLLAITRIDAGALELRKDWIDLAEIVSRVASAARRQHSPTPNITVEVSPDLPLVFADPTLVEQAVANIVGNAIAHTPRQTRIAIALDAEPGWTRVAVTDEGPGISAALLPRLFEKFLRDRQSEHGQGIGLGLAIAKGIMDAHGGSILADSPVAGGRGTRVVLTFPQRTDQA